MKMNISPDREKKLKQFIKEIQVPIKSLNLLHIALTHSSYSKEHTNNEDNQRLEFFGDAVLKLFISEYLMKQYPSYNEGKLSNLRAYVVSEKVLYKIAVKLKIVNFLLTGKNEKQGMPVSIPADSVEALLAVMYYDCGDNVTRNFILKHWSEYVEYAEESKEKENYKAALQEYTQANDLGLPTYKTISESGPDHKKIFEVGVYIKGEHIGTGHGETKKIASQLAAKKVYNRLITNSSKK